MKVLVTGHLGYIGAVLVPILLNRGHDVSGLDSDLFAACTFIGDIADTPSIGEDVRDFVVNPKAVELLRGFDAIIHLAGLSNDPLGDYQPNLTKEINADASITLARLAKEAGVSRFVFASSCSNYGASSDDFIDENGDLNPVTPYGDSKVAVEAAVQKLASSSFSPTFLRASTAYGLSPRLRFDLVVNNLTAWAHATGEVRLKSDGSPWRPIVHVEDIAYAYVAVIEAERNLVHKQAFNVGQTSENYQIREIATIVHEVVPNTEIGFAPGASPDIRNYRVDCNYICRTLRNYKPQWTCRRGVEQLLAAYQSADVQQKDFEGERYQRIAHVKHRIDSGSLGIDLRPQTS